MSLYDDASLIMFPSGYKEDKIYSLKPTDGSGDLTFTRASTATRVNADGLIETSPVNLLEQSNTFNTTWIAVNSGSVVSGQSGYDGSSNAWTLTKIATSYSGIKQNIIYSDTSTFAIYAKANTLNYLWIEEYPTGGNIWFDLINGTTSGSGFLSSSMTSVGNGWWKCLMTASGNRTVLNFYPQATSGVTSTAGSIYIQNAQVNIGSTAKPYFPTTDRLNVPRIDYTGGGCGKLLLEPQRTNSLTYSEAFDNAIYTKLRLTTSANTSVSPDGYANADSIFETADNNTHEIYQRPSVTSAQPITFSCFIKANGRRRVQLQIFDSSTLFASALFDVISGEVIATSGTSKIENYGNGWYRCVITGTSPTTSSGYALIGLARDTYTNAIAIDSYAGDVTKGVLLYGAQTEANASYATSYIPTLASSVTRLADAAFKTGISSLIGQTSGTIFLELSSLENGVDNEQIALSDGTDSNTIKFVFGSAVGGVKAEGKVGGVGQFGITQSTSDYISNKKIAIGYKENDFVFYYNGVQVGVDTAGTAPTMSAFNFSTGASSFLWNGKVNQAILFPTRLTNDQLADLTGGNKTTFNALAEFYGYQIL